jgi:hypothetical protein
MTLRPVDCTAARVALHQSVRSRGYKFLREGTDPIYLRWSVCVDLVRCVSVDPPMQVPTSLFIVPKGRARVTIVVKRWNEEKMKEKKGGPKCDGLPPYPVWAVYPVAQICNGHWSFGLSIRRCNMLWPCFILCAPMPSRMGGACAWICVERGLGGIVAVAPAHCRCMDVVMVEWPGSC